MTANATGRGFGNSTVYAATQLASVTGLGTNDRIAMSSESGHVWTQSDMSKNAAAQAHERGNGSTDDASTL